MQCIDEPSRKGSELGGHETMSEKGRRVHGDRYETCCRRRIDQEASCDRAQHTDHGNIDMLEHCDPDSDIILNGHEKEFWGSLCQSPS